MPDNEDDAMAEDAAYENAFSIVPGMGEAAPAAAHTLEMLENLNTDTANNPQEDETLDRERALALQKGQNAQTKPQNMAIQSPSSRPLPH